MNKSVGSVAFVLPGLGAGGSEHVVSMLCNELAERGFAVTLLAFVEVGTKHFYPHHERWKWSTWAAVRASGRLGQLLAQSLAFIDSHALRHIHQTW